MDKNISKYSLQVGIQGKKYGLQLSKNSEKQDEKNKMSQPKKALGAFFGNESDDEGDNVGAQLQRDALAK